MDGILRKQPLTAVSLENSFFDSLRDDYVGFDGWFTKKANQGEEAYIMRSASGGIQGFLYLKTEDDVMSDVVPPLPAAKRMKVGTMKIISHGTKLGERFAKKIFDEALAREVDEIYVTVFAKHTGLIKLFTKYGFEIVAKKPSANGNAEEVMVRMLGKRVGDIVKDYPFIHSKHANKHLLAIYPDYHTQLLPDSILHNESYDIVEDVSHTNSIHKVYIGKTHLTIMKPGDIIVFYRTADRPPAAYRSVATSIGVVEETRAANSFSSEAEFVGYCDPHSVFPEEALKTFYAAGNTKIVKFLYNAAMSKRLIRKCLIEEVGIPAENYWNFFKITDEQFDSIVDLGGVNARLIID